jgi:hypothetical protein
LHRQELAGYTGGWIEQTQVVAGAGDVGSDVDSSNTSS